MQINKQQSIHYTLRIAVAMCFIGHGAFGIITKAVWCNYFAVFGIGQELSYRLMPVVGTIDILLGVSMLVFPLMIIPAWLVIWGFATALLRPLSGEPLAEFIERAGNYGAPLCLLLLSGIPQHNRDWFSRIKPATQVDAVTRERVTHGLQIVAFLLFLGHGWLNLMEKAALVKQYTSLGFSNPVQVAHIIGIAEIAAAFFVLIKPVRPVLFALFVWKVASELAYPHYAVFEWIERGGSYGTLLALWIITGSHSVSKSNSPTDYKSKRIVWNSTE